MSTMNSSFVSTRNPCKLCAPLGAVLAFLGVEGGVGFIHGSQGCATYIRRYLISHFREAVDIGSSSFSEETAVFGGGHNLKTGLANIARQYRPQMIGVATSCLSETIGDDVPRFIREFREETSGDLPAIVHVSSPSYRGTHIDGFHDAVAAMVRQLAVASGNAACCAIFPGMQSTADLRWLKRTAADFGISATMLPDYSDTLEGGLWDEWRRIAPGGTPVSAIAASGSAEFAIELGHSMGERRSAGAYLAQTFGVRRMVAGMPVGVDLTDAFFEILSSISASPVPAEYAAQRRRLLDAYVDGHKYISGKRAIVCGEADLVRAVTSFLSEIGIRTVITGGEEADFASMEEAAAELEPDIVIGNSKGYSLARKLNIPLVRVGFPVHDRFGGQRIRILGYDGTLELYDRIVNALLTCRQDANPVGYTYY